MRRKALVLWHTFLRMPLRLPKHWKKLSNILIRRVQFAILTGLNEEIALSRSDVLAIALRGQAAALGWKRGREAARQMKNKHFGVTDEVRATARRLNHDAKNRAMRRHTATAQDSDSPAAQDSAASPFSTQEPYIEYGTYFGFLHAHSSLADGRGTPLQAYRNGKKTKVKHGQNNAEVFTEVFSSKLL